MPETKSKTVTVKLPAEIMIPLNNSSASWKFCPADYTDPGAAVERIILLSGIAGTNRGNSEAHRARNLEIKDKNGNLVPSPDRRILTTEEKHEFATDHLAAVAAGTSTRSSSVSPEHFWIREYVRTHAPDVWKSRPGKLDADGKLGKSEPVKLADITRAAIVAEYDEEKYAELLDLAKTELAKAPTVKL